MDQSLIYDPYLEKYILISIIKNNKRYYLLKNILRMVIKCSFLVQLIQIGPSLTKKT